MEKVSITLRLPKELIAFIESKKKQLIDSGLSKSEVSSQSVIEGLIAYWKEMDEVTK